MPPGVGFEVKFKPDPVAHSSFLLPEDPDIQNLSPSPALGLSAGLHISCPDNGNFEPTPIAVIEQ